MEKHARSLQNMPYSSRWGRDHAVHPREQPSLQAGSLPSQEEVLARQQMQKMQQLRHRVTAISRLCQQLQQVLAGWTKTGLPFIHQYLIERLAAAIVKRAEQLQQDVRRDLAKMVSRADEADEVS